MLLSSISKSDLPRPNAAPVVSTSCPCLPRISLSFHPLSPYLLSLCSPGPVSLRYSDAGSWVKGRHADWRAALPGPCPPLSRAPVAVLLVGLHGTALRINGGSADVPGVEPARYEGFITTKVAPGTACSCPFLEGRGELIFGDYIHPPPLAPLGRGASRHIVLLYPIVEDDSTATGVVGSSASREISTRGYHACPPTGKSAFPLRFGGLVPGSTEALDA